MQDQTITANLDKFGYCVIPDFLNIDLAQQISFDFIEVEQMHFFEDASVGQGHQRRVNIRSDQTYWLGPKNLSIAQNSLLNRVDALKQVINQDLYMGLNHFEGHYSRYQKGGFYKRHLDCFQKNNDRVISVVIFLNQNWNPEHGGQLRIYDKNTVIDIDPTSGTMVCFLSREIEHEVLTTNSSRMSFTGWFKS